ncbi:MAG: hypothetical protein ACU0B1_07425 [Thermohalobaculum sp.]
MIDAQQPRRRQPPDLGRHRAGITDDSEDFERSFSEPTRTASNTVVTPAEAISPSWATTAAPWGQATVGRGFKWRSRLSVCSSIRPGTTVAPPQSSAPAGTRAPESTAAITPPRTATDPVTTSPASTSRALASTRSGAGTRPASLSCIAVAPHFHADAIPVKR